MAFVQQMITIARSLPPPVRAVCADDRSGNVLVAARNWRRDRRNFMSDCEHSPCPGGRSVSSRARLGCRYQSRLLRRAASIPAYPLSFYLSSPLRRQGSSDFALCEHAPAERGIHAGVSLASRRASHFSLRGQREVTKRKATPKRWSPDSCPATSRQDSGGSLTALPCAGSELGAILRAHPAGLSCAQSPPLTGPL
jgi:hypothetical protein